MAMDTTHRTKKEILEYLEKLTEIVEGCLDEYDYDYFKVVGYLEQITRYVNNQKD